MKNRSEEKKETNDKKARARAFYFFSFLLAKEINDNVMAQYLIGDFLLNGIMVDKDINEAFKFFSMAAFENCGPALSDLGWCYAYGHGIFFFLLLSHCFLGFFSLLLVFLLFSLNPSQILFISSFKGVAPSHKKAFNLYQIAADQGITCAQFNLGKKRNHTKTKEKMKRRT